MKTTTATTQDVNFYDLVKNGDIKHLFKDITEVEECLYLQEFNLSKQELNAILEYCNNELKDLGIN